MRKLSVSIISAILLLTVSCSQPVRKSEPVTKKQVPVQEQVAQQTPVVQQEVKTVTPTVQSDAKKEVSVITRDADEGITDPFIEDGINWSNRTITATGIGAPNPDAPNMAVKRAGAINAAKLVALRDLIATMKGMYLSSEQTAENYMMTSDVVKTQIEGIAKAFKVVGEPKYFEDGSVEVTVEMSINGDLSDVFLKDTEFGEGEDYPLVPEATYKLSDLVKEPSAYTGIIIDCTSVQLRPALAPKVFSKSGEEVYGSANVNKDYAVQQGMMGYLKSVTSARENSRVTSNPLIINAIGVKGTNKADIIISDEDAAKLKDLDSRLNVLKQCRVIAVII